MTNGFLDYEGKELNKGFYRFYDSGKLIYFTGEYKRQGAVFEEVELTKKITLPREKCSGLLEKVDKEKISKKLEILKNEANWLEKRLKE